MVKDRDITLLIDVNDLYRGSMSFRKKRIDYKALLSIIVETHGPIRYACAFGSGKENSNTENFRAFLRHIGFECRWKANYYDWNVGITTTAITQMPKTDLLILGSSSPLLVDCVELIRRNAILCYAYGFRISHELRESVDQFFELSDNVLIKEEDSSKVRKSNDEAFEKPE